MRPGCARRLLGGLLLGAVVPTLPLSGIPPAVAGGAPGGTAQVTAPPSKGGGRLTSGGSSTPFQLKLPSGAACTGDSANGSYRVQGYMVPGTDDPAVLSFRSQGPLGPGRRPLYDVQTSAYANAQTAKAEPPDGPGVIVNVPLFSYAVFTPDDIAPGSYNIGIACSRNGQVDRFWNARVAIARDRADMPAALAWRVEGGPGSSGSTAPLKILLLAGIVVAGLVLYRLRRSRGENTSSTPSHPGHAGVSR